MLQIISEQGISEYIINTFLDNRPVSTDNWQLAWYHSTGGQKRKWFLGASECPIESIEFEMNERICGAGNITLAYVDFPIDADDYIIVYYNGLPKYRAIVTNTADPKGGSVELMPYSIRFQELLYNGSFATKTIAEIMQTIIEAVFDDTGIVYNSIYINTGSTDTFTIQYEYEYVNKILNGLMERLDDRYWGVDVNNTFTVYTDNTEIDQYMYQIDKPLFQSMDVDRDYDNIKTTRYQVYKKSGTSGQIARVGQVGYDAPGGSYPTLPIEKIVRKKEDKITVSEILSNAGALRYAYAKLQAETDIPLSININSIDLSRYYPSIKQLIKCQDVTEQILRTIINCESTTNWSGSVTISLDTNDFVEGSASISCEFTGATEEIVYDLTELKHWKNIKKIGFMLKADYAGDYLELFAYSGESPYLVDVDEYLVNIDEYLGSYGSTYNFKQVFHIPTGGVWDYYEFDVSVYPAFEYIGIRCIATPPASSTINIDRIQIYDEYRTEYEANIKELKFTIDKYGGNCNAILNKINTGANDMLFKIDARIKKIETVSQQ